MDNSSDQPHPSSQIFQVCATAIVQSQAQNHQLRTYAESQKREAESSKLEADCLRTEIQQLRNVVLYVERERDQEISKSTILQQLIETQRRIIRDYEQDRHGQMSAHVTGPVSYGSGFHQAFTHVPVSQENPVEPAETIA